MEGSIQYNNIGMLEGLPNELITDIFNKTIEDGDVRYLKHLILINWRLYELAKNIITQLHKRDNEIILLINEWKIRIFTKKQFRRRLGSAMSTYMADMCAKGCPKFWMRAYIGVIKNEYMFLKFTAGFCSDNNTQSIVPINLSQRYYGYINCKIYDKSICGHMHEYRDIIGKIRYWLTSYGISLLKRYCCLPYIYQYKYNSNPWRCSVTWKDDNIIINRR
jgi:hypothetical protein